MIHTHTHIGMKWLAMKTKARCAVLPCAALSCANVGYQSRYRWCRLWWWMVKVVPVLLPLLLPMPLLYPVPCSLSLVYCGPAWTLSAATAVSLSLVYRGLIKACLLLLPEVLPWRLPWRLLLLLLNKPLNKPLACGWWVVDNVSWRHTHARTPSYPTLLPTHSHTHTRTHVVYRLQ
jgi:hypothetical protein